MTGDVEKGAGRHFFMAFDPPTATQQEKRIGVRGGKPYTYPDERWAKARDALWSQLEPHRPDSPLEGPLELSVTWCFPLAGHADGEPKATPPDTDNLDKGLKDVMTALGWWHDDAQVAVEHIAKVHGRVTGIRVDIEGLVV